MAFASSRIGAQEAIIKPCDLCEDEENVNWFCKDCDQTLCDRCKKTHFRSKVSKSHIVLSISEGFAMGKRNISNICQDHDELFTFFCRTCDMNICSKCLSKEHKKHDFVDLRELQIEVKKQIDDVIKGKEIEKQKMTQNYDDLSQHKIKSGLNLKKQCDTIDDRANDIKLAVEEEKRELKKFLCLEVNEQNEQVEDGKERIQTQTKLYDIEIQTVKQELRLQTASSLNVFIRNSMTKLKSLQPVFVAIPDTIQIDTSRSEGVDRNQIRGVIGKILRSQKVTETKTTRGKNGTKCNVLSTLELLRKLNLNNTGEGKCLCLCPDGCLWIGGRTCVLKLSSDCSTVIHKIYSGDHFCYLCGYIACLRSGDAVVTYVGRTFIDRFTSDGRREEFEELSRSTYDIAVNNQDEVLINVDDQSIVIFSNEGTQLREFPVDGGIKTFCTDRDRNIIIATREGSPRLTVLDDMSGNVKTSWTVSMIDISSITCDIYGNIIATNKDKNVYFFSKDGKIQETYTVDSDEIKGICVNKENHLLILIKVNNEDKILETKYLE